ncbi:DUF3280 domain-containing protein [Halomonas sp. WWR20]
MNRRTMPRRRLLGLAFACSSLAWVSSVLGAEVSASPPRTIVVLPFDLMDTSPLNDINQGPQADDLARLGRTQQTIRQGVDARPEFTLLDNAALATPLESAKSSYRYLHACNGCERKIAQSLGAELVMVGWVQKVSNLILNMNAVIRDVASGRDLAGASVDMRGNTDEAWTRAAERLLDDDLMRSYQATRHKLQQTQ